MNYSRLRILTLTLLACFFLVIGRFFYWQIIKYDDLHQKVISQNYKTVTFNAVRGQIFDSQNNPLAINQDFYQKVTQFYFMAEDVLETQPGLRIILSMLHSFYILMSQAPACGLIHIQPLVMPISR